MSATAPWAALASLHQQLPTRLLDAYADEIIRWNRAIRLVGPRDLIGVQLQIVDALLPFLLNSPEFPLVDIGSGAGLPGIPLAAAFPDARVACVEPKAKKVSFLRNVVRVLRLENVEIIPCRAEDIDEHRRDLMGAFATVTARAVADTCQVLTWARFLLIPRGRVFLLCGPSEPAPVVCGYRLVVDKGYEPPPGLGLRRLVVYEVA